MSFPSFWSPVDLATLRGKEREVAEHVAGLFAEIDGIGHAESNSDAGYHRLSWSSEEAWLRVWFAAHMQRRGFTVHVDTAGNQWAWMGDPTTEHPGVTIGSHLDSVPGGGAFDGPLGVISAIAAFDVLRSSGWEAPCPFAIVNFHDEEGGRFAVACFGSRTLTGLLMPGRALAMKDKQGISYRQALERFPELLEDVRRRAPHSETLGDFTPRQIALAVEASAAPSPETLKGDVDYMRLSAAHVELHIEQGRAQCGMGAPVAVADKIWPHGRWRLEIDGMPNHAGCTPMDQRHDPMRSFVKLVDAVNVEAEKRGARVTIGKIICCPNGVNVIPGRITCWLDCRAQDESQVNGVVDAIAERIAHGEFDTGAHSGADDAPDVRILNESWTESTVFSASVRNALLEALSVRHEGSEVPVIGTAAGHDAGILAETGSPAGMLFVRNMTGASHTPAEFATLSDSALGVLAYAKVLKEFSESVSRGWRPSNE
ncbi:MAG: Zn-dependent hydrolase [Bifidobacterium adolescentis]|nr:Zn-dependent hydrolase [Bifidobacterium adolescentis]